LCHQAGNFAAPEETVMSPADPSVCVWVQQLREGDKDVPVQKLWERYFQQLVGLARFMLGSRPRRVADEEDVALSAFDSFCQGVLQGRYPQLNARDDLWRLLVTIAVRKVYRLNLRNSCAKRGGNAVLDEAALIGTDSGDPSGVGLEQFLATDPTPEFAAQAAEQYWRLLGMLEDEKLRWLAQWKMEGFTNEEIAAKLGCTRRTVERRLAVVRSIWSNEEAA
jgi:DNA-directed RNA polymerase specialized sigma24 family protein